MRTPKPLEKFINGFEVVKDLGYARHHNRYAIFKCKVCQKEFECQVNMAKVRPSCGCLGSHRRTELPAYINGFRIIKDLKFDKVTKFRSAIVECKVCKREYKVAVYGLKYRKNCGCVIKGTKVSKYTHSHREILYTWRRMKSRCYKPNNKDYYNYGERGITVCDEWLNDQDSFVKWALKNGWEKGLSIDRIDNDKGYSPDNCRWISMLEQARNKRNNVLNMELAREIRKESSSMTKKELVKKYKIRSEIISRVLKNQSWTE